MCARRSHARGHEPQAHAHTRLAITLTHTRTRFGGPQVELKTGETYRGTLVEAEDNWNSQMKDITVTGRVRWRGPVFL